MSNYKQLLVQTVAEQITFLEQRLRYEKMDKRYFWSNSDADRPDATRPFFNALKESQTNIRKINAKLKSLRKAQKRLKQLPVEAFSE